MTDRVPSLFMLVPGPWRDSEHLVAVLRELDIHAEVTKAGAIRRNGLRVDVIEDHDLRAAFSWGLGGAQSAGFLDEVAGCSRAALIEYGVRLDESPRDVARLGRAMREAGGVGVRMEASSAASPWTPWLDSLESGDPFQIYASTVQLVQDHHNVMFTCGMHQFDLPDAQIAMPDPSRAMSWLNAFSVYQLAEQPVLASGHTFSPDADQPRRKLERWPDHRHRSDDGRQNPFGLWRLLDPRASRLEAASRTPIIVPALVATLSSAESAAQRPLTREEVEQLISNAPAIVMKLQDAIMLERSRGYADIEPELAWEQWQVVRGTMNLGMAVP
ncbi:MAG: DUF4261 domain-containing protein [Polyangiaceae bacterium]